MNRPLRLATIAFVCALPLASCAVAFTTITAERLDGTWDRVFGYPGSSERWHLAVQGTRVTGTGTWTGEACCAGTLTVSGVISGDSLHVDVTETTTLSANGVQTYSHHFDGVLRSPGLLEGVISTSGSPTQPVQFKKTE